MNPFNTFGLDVYTYLKHIGVQIKAKITGKTASGFLLFWQNTGPKKPVNEPSPLRRKFGLRCSILFMLYCTRTSYLSYCSSSKQCQGRRTFHVSFPGIKIGKNLQNKQE